MKQTDITKSIIMNTVFENGDNNIVNNLDLNLTVAGYLIPTQIISVMFFIFRFIKNIIIIPNEICIQ